MNVAELQRRVGAAPDGQWGARSKAALLAAFANTSAVAITPPDLAGVAARLGCSVDQLQAVRKVEAAGAGFDRDGRPKILFERHKFHAFTAGRFSPAAFSQSVAGGYTVDADRNGIDDSWDRLSAAIATGAVDAAFMACSWGAFQVMGQWWDALGYAGPYEMAASSVRGEPDQLDMLVRYVLHFRLQGALRAISRDPATCRAFAAAYNGPGYARYRYDERLAAAMPR